MTDAFSDSKTDSKADLRRRFREYRHRLPDSEWSRRSAAIRERVQVCPELRFAQTVHVYWPQMSDREVDTRPLIDTLAAHGTTVVLPVVTAYPPEAPALDHRRFTGRDTLTPNRWGIPEPTGTPSVDPAALDVVLVPALGAGRNGHRIGHGAGYYDAFLTQTDAITIALVYDATLVPAVPAEAHDQPLDAIATETTLVRP